MNKIKTSLFFLLALCCLAGCSEAPEGTRIYLAGDSTMANKPDPATNPERGWGQLLHEVFDARVEVHNHAVNGRSSRSFIAEGRWTAIVDSLSPGDYVFIQFGHNDMKEYDPDRYSNPWSGYRHNLERMVRDCIEKEAHPVLLSSIVRRKFNENGTLVDTHGPYPFVARQVALTEEIPFIDLQQMTEDRLIELGPEASRELFLIFEPGEHPMFPEGKTDNTHLGLEGAREVARMVAWSLEHMELPLAQYLVK